MSTQNSKPRKITRREMLKRAGGSSLVLAAASSLSPFLFTGCSGGKKSGGSGGSIKVGILHSLTGFMAISEKSLHDVELMAIEEINEAGGVLGKKVEPIVEDPASNFETGFPEKARKLLLDDRVDAVFGCWTSASRKSVLEIFEENNGLLFYPVQYEGNECSRNVVYTGAAPNQQILPAVDYLWNEMGKRKFYLLGSDYIFPRTANQIIRAQLKNVYKAEPVQERYADLKQRDFKDIVDDIRKVEPDVIFSTINGDSNIPFYNELANNGITADKIPVCAVSVAEDELRGLIGKTAIKGHLAAWNYFQSVDLPSNKKFVEKFKSKYGKDRVTDDPIEAAYFQVYFWKNAVEKAQSTEVDKVIAAIQDPEKPITFDAPGGMVKIDPENMHTWKPFRMGRVREDGQFDIIFEKKDKSGNVELIRPDPYPRVAYNKTCNWIKAPKKGVIELDS
ncbi:MAG: urea ABC transporter substrate-binding protein [Gemmatales bacterium]|nr:MAG: urea ABC transporter substrate-binding protein [Gemmatales bacterium]